MVRMRNNNIANEELINRSMTRKQLSANKQLFIEAVKAYLENRTVEWSGQVSAQDWSEIFKLASAHNVLPMVYESVYGSKVYRESEVPFETALKRQAQQQVVLQVRKTEEFRELYRSLAGRGLQPIVVKGIICRQMYPSPDSRISGDEDLYIPKGTYEEYHRALLDAGMELASWELPDIDARYARHEVTYVKPGGVLRIELHKNLFETASQVYEEINELFENAFENSVIEDVGGLTVRTMGYSDHLLYLILHAFKHFVHSGFGIRQVCDIMIYVRLYGNEIHWNEVFEKCCRMQAAVFAASLFDIGSRYFGVDIDQAGFPKEWKALAVDSEDLLEDLLASGIYGGPSMSRKHSSNITLNAISAGKQGKTAEGAVMRAIFLPRKSLESRYYYLKKYPFLLPVAWLDRLIRYSRETKGTARKENSALESVKIGNQRIELMKKYKII